MQFYQGPLKWLPLIVTAIAMAELYILWRKKRAFDWRETLASLVISVGQRLAALAGAGLFGGLYWLVWQARLFEVPLNTWWGLSLLFFGQEFLYYWEHRLSHECRWFWASHVVHHSPNFMNLSAAYRLSWTAPFTGQNLVFLPLVWLGFHPLAVFAMLGVICFTSFGCIPSWCRAWVGLIASSIRPRIIGYTMQPMCSIWMPIMAAFLSCLTACLAAISPSGEMSRCALAW